MAQKAPPRIDFSGKVAIAGDPRTEAEILEAPGAIGKIVIFQISDDLRVPPDDLKAAMERHGIDLDYAPKPIKPDAQIKGVLKKTKRTIALEHTVRPGKVETVKYSVSFPEIREKEGGAIVAPLVRMRYTGRSDSGEDWDARTVARVSWDPDVPNEIDAEINTRYADEYPYHEILAAVEEEFVDRISHYSGNAIGSSIVMPILNDTMSVTARPAGGVWLVPREHIGLLKGVEDFIKDLTANHNLEDGRESYFESVILFDGEENQLFIRGQVEGQVVRQLADALDALKKLSDAKVAPRPNELSNAIAIRRDALALRDHYATVVGPEFQRVSTALELFDRYYAAAVADRDADTSVG